ncbi:MAG TPA: AAA family ATPase [Bryobacteraceae bacterium]|jgi:predicted ATPase
MLTRLYIDNFRCFEKFEWRPGRKQLILGRNGTGKTSLMAALHYIVQVAARGDRVDQWFKLNQRTSWLHQPEQVFEMEVQLNGRNYWYRLVVEFWGEPLLPRVKSEAVRLDGEPILVSKGGEVIFGSQRLASDQSRSALAIGSSFGTSELQQLRKWMGGVRCSHINPFLMGSRVRGSAVDPRLDLIDMAGWYRHLVQAYPKENAAFLEDLYASLDGLNRLWLEYDDENNATLYAEFSRKGRATRIPFGELSDGQRCIVCLYAIGHFVAARGGTVIIDEPDNFISLREIQPWLMRIEEIADDNDGQVILISHHPEILNQWAGPYGVQFIRDGAGPVRVEKFKGDPGSALTVAELVARGWDLG